MPRAQLSNKPKQIQNDGQHENRLFSRKVNVLATDIFLANDEIRTSSVTGLSDMTDPGNNALVNNVSYNPSNQLLTLNYRTSSYNSFTDKPRGYNTLLQLTSLTAGSLSATYNYPTSSNNGRISSSVINGETVTYQYDSLNRLIQATSSAGWGETYAFDGFGNLTTKTPTAGSAPTL